ncbi:nuclear transport factor 2 family protein [Sphingobium estronivorans]|uniref:nuclear transport factor 2 family protein n=1 Tax=Sphingobium estronivorans TaxID=1577690 RepID=UPI0013C2D022|nr:nuclear transport factor 2 family protein [Sphingobium estronivorans]
MTGSIRTPAADMALARKFFDSIETGDMQAVVDCYVGDPVIWHNTDGKEMTLADQVAALGFLDAQYPERRFRDRRVSAFEGGFVQQHIFWGRHLDGHEIEFPSCVVCRTRDGRIERLDEYLDSAPFRAPEENRN